jgi:hypothetical protein
MDHPEQPSLPRVRDVALGRQPAGDRQRDVAGLADPLVDLVVDRLVVDQAVQRRGVAKLGVARDVARSGAESDAAQQMLDE